MAISAQTTKQKLGLTIVRCRLDIPELLDESPSLARLVQFRMARESLEMCNGIDRRQNEYSSFTIPYRTDWDN